MRLPSIHFLTATVVLAVGFFTEPTHAEIKDSASTVLVINIDKLSRDEIVAATAVQGIANRSEPSVFLRTVDKFWPVSFSFYPFYKERISPEMLSKFPSPDDFWLDYLGKKWGYKYKTVTDLDELVRLNLDKIKGVVRLREFTPEALSVAATIAGQRDLIPVSDETAMRWPALANLPIIVDLRDRFPKDISLEILRKVLQWAVAEYLPGSDKENAFSYCPGQFGYLTLDLAISRRMYCYNLGHFDPKGDDLPDEAKKILMRPSPSGLSREEEHRLLDQILSHLNPYSMVWGWDQESEDGIATTVAKYGCAVTCCTANNLSFYLRVPSHQEMMPRQRQLKESDVKVEDKYYIAFVSGAGDAAHTATSLMCNGRWLYSARGKVPMNWTISPYLVEKAPGLMECYYEMASPNDYFVNETAGYGYNHPGRLPDKFLFGYAEKIKAASLLADTHYQDLWWQNGIQPESKRRDWEAATGLNGYFFWEGPQRIVFPPGAPIEISSERFFKDYWPKDDPQKTPQALAQSLMRQLADTGTQRPWFTVIYDLDPNFAAETMALLPKDKFKAVLMDEFFMAASKARSSIESHAVGSPPNLNGK